MAFTGKYQSERVENAAALFKTIGYKVPDYLVNPGAIVTEVIQEGDNFTWIVTQDSKTTTNNFTIGKESKMTTNSGISFMATPWLVGGKLLIQFPRCLRTTEISGGKLINNFTLNGEDGVTMKLVSKEI